MIEKVKITVELEPFYAKNLRNTLEFIINHQHYQMTELDIDLLQAVVDGLKENE